MEKPAACAVCEAPIEQPATGRPRVYCGEGCRRTAEYELRRVQALLLLAEKRELAARAKHKLADYRAPGLLKAVKFWQAEVAARRARLAALLAGATGDGDDGG